MPLELGSAPAATAVCSLPRCGEGLGVGVVVIRAEKVRGRDTAMNQDNPIMLVAAARDAFANCYPHPNPSPQGGGEHTECVTTGLPRAQRKCSRPRARTRLLRR